jgi:hypothetical protein
MIKGDKNKKLTDWLNPSDYEIIFSDPAYGHLPVYIGPVKERDMYGEVDENLTSLKAKRIENQGFHMKEKNWVDNFAKEGQAFLPEMLYKDFASKKKNLEMLRGVIGSHRNVILTRPLDSFTGHFVTGSHVEILNLIDNGYKPQPCNDDPDFTLFTWLDKEKNEPIITDYFDEKYYNKGFELLKERGLF